MSGGGRNQLLGYRGRRQHEVPVPHPRLQSGRLFRLEERLAGHHARELGRGAQREEARRRGSVAGPRSFVHPAGYATVASSELLERRRAGLPVTAETCPHYLTFAAEDIPDGATAFKCAPPIREGDNRTRLWDGLERGAIDLVASDHSPAPPALKQVDTGDFLAAWGGIASLQLSLPLMWTAARARGHGLADVARWMSTGPARLAGLSGKGAIATGADADLVLFDPDERWHVEVAELHHRHPVTPYAGRELTGRVRATLLRGRPVVCDGKLQGPPAGRLLRRGGR